MHKGILTCACIYKHLSIIATGLHVDINQIIACWVLDWMAFMPLNSLIISAETMSQTIDHLQPAGWGHGECKA